MSLIQIWHLSSNLFFKTKYKTSFIITLLQYSHSNHFVSSFFTHKDNTIYILKRPTRSILNKWCSESWLLKAFFIKENTILYIYILKQPARGIIKKRCSENMQQIYRRIHMPKCDFNNVALHLWVAASIYWEIFAKLWLWFLWLH